MAAKYNNMEAKGIAEEELEEEEHSPFKMKVGAPSKSDFGDGKSNQQFMDKRLKNNSKSNMLVEAGERVYQNRVSTGNDGNMYISETYQQQHNAVILADLNISGRKKGLSNQTPIDTQPSKTSKRSHYTN